MPQIIFKAWSYSDLFSNMSVIKRTYKNPNVDIVVSHTEGRVYKETYLIVIVSYDALITEEEKSDE